MSTIFEKNRPGFGSRYLPELSPELQNIGELPAELTRETTGLPEVPEVEVVRHYTALSRKNFGVDNGFYPLGSCTMKYNPKINETLASLPSFTGSHPLWPEELVQGNLELLHDLQAYLCEITGMAGCTLQPAAGAHGELTGLMIVKAYFQDKGENRHKIITPDSSHGTNPATVTMCGFTPVALKSNTQGLIDLKALEELMSEDVAAMMLTNPNTLGLFEKDIAAIAEIVHSKGGLLYCDGANANAVLGVSRFGDMGYDITHLNLHKTFSTPHGGGGPGAGPVCVTEKLTPYLPGPVIRKKGEGYTAVTPERSIGRMKAFYGNFGILVRAYTFIAALGAEGIHNISRDAVLNANYMRARLEKHFHLAYPGLCKHEFVLDDSKMPGGVKTMDIAKRLLDFGYHPPTIYFPLIVPGAMMIEPTETETKETLDGFIETMLKILEEAEKEPETVKGAPHTTIISRLDEVQAARAPVITFEE